MAPTCSQNALHHRSAPPHTQPHNQLGGGHDAVLKPGNPIPPSPPPRLRNAFWALMLPAGVSARVSDIWRGYCAQKLLPAVGGRVVFFPPSAFQVSLQNRHSF